MYIAIDLFFNNVTLFLFFLNLIIFVGAHICMCAIINALKKKIYSNRVTCDNLYENKSTACSQEENLKEVVKVEIELTNVLKNEKRTNECKNENKNKKYNKHESTQLEVDNEKDDEDTWKDSNSVHSPLSPLQKLQLPPVQQQRYTKFINPKEYQERLSCDANSSSDVKGNILKTYVDKIDSYKSNNNNGADKSAYHNDESTENDQKLSKNKNVPESLKFKEKEDDDLFSPLSEPLDLDIIRLYVGM